LADISGQLKRGFISKIGELTMTIIKERLERGDIIILDGAMGTELEKRGVPMDGVAWSGAAVKSHPEIVRQVHEEYIRAGADIIITNTFSMARHVLEPAGLGDQFESLNRRAVALAQAARDRVAGRDVAIAGSISTFDAHNQAAYRPMPAQTQANYRAQAEALAEAGVDLFMMEMMIDIEQATYAVQAAVATGRPVWLGFSCKIDAAGRVVLFHQEHTLSDALAALTPLGGELMSIMHTHVADAGPALSLLAEQWAGPKGVYLHSGHFVMPNWQFVNIISPEDYAAQAQSWVAQGYQVIGGCCGTGPEHIRRLKERIGMTP
jgi:S-methylmethionine-dependent homocysteine/selenocysteine methylase